MVSITWSSETLCAPVSFMAMRQAFTAFTGETGSGKTMLLGALGAALGGRVERELIRDERLRVALEVAPDEALLAALREMGIEPEADDDVVIVREVTAAGRNAAPSTA